MLYSIRFAFKQILLCYLCLGSMMSAFCQMVAVENNNGQGNKVYVGIDNRLTIVAENVDCDQLYVVANNGEIILPEACYYNLRPDSLGIVALLISEIVEGDTILLRKKMYRAQSLPIQAKVANLSGGTVRSGLLKAQEGMVAYLSGLAFDAHFDIQAFTLQIYRQQCIHTRLENKGGRFGSDVKTALQNIQIGDELIFTNITAAGSSEELFDLEEIRLRVVK